MMCAIAGEIFRNGHNQPERRTEKLTAHQTPVKRATSIASCSTNPFISPLTAAHINNPIKIKSR